MSLIKYLLVHAYKAGKLNDIKSFFADCGDTLMRRPHAEEWSAWFALPYISSPSSHVTFQAYFLPSSLSFIVQPGWLADLLFAVGRCKAWVQGS